MNIERYVLTIHCGLRKPIKRQCSNMSAALATARAYKRKYPACQIDVQKEKLALQMADGAILYEDFSDVPAIAPMWKVRTAKSLLAATQYITADLQQMLILIDKAKHDESIIVMDIWQVSVIAVSS